MIQNIYTYFLKKLCFLSCVIVATNEQYVLSFI